MSKEAEILTRGEWVEQPAAGVRMKFRPDGTGFYEREGTPGSRFVRDNLLHRMAGDRLELKFAHARGWTEVGFSLAEGAGSAGARLGRWVLRLAKDPYAAAFEERETGPLALASDSGPTLGE